jgi:hypothetical protein
MMVHVLPIYSYNNSPNANVDLKVEAWSNQVLYWHVILHEGN